MDPDQASETELSSTNGLVKATTFKSKEVIEEYWFLTGECLGEMLHINYRDELLLHTTLDGKGGYHMMMRWRPVGTVATGAVTGRVWKPVGAAPIIEHSGKIGQKYIYTQAGCYNWKAQQKGPNLTEPWTIHITVNADGETIVHREIYRFICNPDR
jgi:hypothetical protein